MATFSNYEFITKTLQFDNKHIDISIPMSDAKFGIINLTAPTIPLTKEHIDFIFTIDCSGSMSDMCSDGRTKMQHILHTLTNMMLYFKENHLIQCHITVNAFDNTIYTIISRCQINDENYSEIISKINKIYPRQSTNIELALNSVKELAAQIKTDFSQNNIVNIFMTDGEASSGNTNKLYLSSLVDKSITNAFIGFGISHDDELLNSFSDDSNSSYYFIDKLEYAGFVYGEILHGILYKFLTNVEITVHNGLLYDFKNNTWNSTLSVGAIVSESDKIYNVISSNPEECFITLSAKNSYDNTNFQIIIKKQEDNVDLTKYMYRQRTLQHLYIVGDLFKREKIYNTSRFYEDILQPPTISFTEEKNKIRENLRIFISEMKTFMTEKNLQNDKFMKNLCDDIYINYTTIETKFGSMYNNARQISQGSQRCYTVNHTPPEEQLDGCNEEHSQSYTQFISSFFKCTNKSKTDDPIVDHIVSEFDDTPYQTPSATKLMREISCKPTSIHIP